MGNIQKTLILAFAGAVLVPFVPLRTHRWARELYGKLKRELSFPQEISEAQVRKTLYRLKTREYLKATLVKKDETTATLRFELTAKGKKLLGNYQLAEMRIGKPKRWDGKWHFVLFDVPEKFHSLRDALRERLRTLGFFQIQKSVWVHPYPCQKEVAFLCERLGLQKYTLIFEAFVPNDRELHKYFKKKGFAL